MSMKEDLRGGENYYNDIKHKKHSLKKYERQNGKDYLVCNDYSLPIILYCSKSESHYRFRKHASQRSMAEYCRRGEKVPFRSRYHKTVAILAYQSD